LVASSCQVWEKSSDLAFLQCFHTGSKKIISPDFQFQQKMVSLNSHQQWIMQHNIKDHSNPQTTWESMQVFYSSIKLWPMENHLPTWRAGASPIIQTMLQPQTATSWLATYAWGASMVNSAPWTEGLSNPTPAPMLSQTMWHTQKASDWSLQELVQTSNSQCYVCWLHHALAQCCSCSSQAYSVTMPSSAIRRKWEDIQEFYLNINLWSSRGKA